MVLWCIVMHCSVMCCTAVYYMVINVAWCHARYVCKCDDVAVKLLVYVFSACYCIV